MHAERNPGKERPLDHCLSVLVSPACGERARAKIYPVMRKGYKPCSRQHVRLKTPLFVVEDVEAAKRIIRELGEECSTTVEVVEVCCRRIFREAPPRSYVTIGPAAIVSIDVERKPLDYWRSIARSLLDTVPGIRAVYGKVQTRGRHRVPELVHLAGEELSEVIHVEYGIKFLVPLGRVYMNPRLASEHERLSRRVKEAEIVLDMFAGAGGFTLHIAAKGKAKLIVANDINVHATRSLIHSMHLNEGRLATPIVVVNSDARLLPRLLPPIFTRIIMDLPHASQNFLPHAYKLCSPRGCMIHLYRVGREEREVVSDLKLPARLFIREVRRVLDYAPGKYIFRVDIEAGRVGD
ncbi:MAG: hypothetical protein DSY37_00955 [Hyperthermus sp.]|nr:MAG: hypothetical protein DSY37_00955 [Hyperthermus sp.]